MQIRKQKKNSDEILTQILHPLKTSENLWRYQAVQKSNIGLFF